MLAEIFFVLFNLLAGIFAYNIWHVFPRSSPKRELSVVEWQTLNDKARSNRNLGAEVKYG